jgi:hypothetical protein
MRTTVMVGKIVRRVSAELERIRALRDAAYLDVQDAREAWDGSQVRASELRIAEGRYDELSDRDRVLRLDLGKDDAPDR